MLRSPVRLFFWLFLPLLALSAGAGLAFSKWYWGYWIQPPGVPEVTERFETVESVTPLMSAPNATELQLAIAPNFESDRTSRPRLGDTDYRVRKVCDTEFCDSYRVLRVLYDRGQLPTNPPQVEFSQLAELERAIVTVGQLVSPVRGYETLAFQMNGVLLEAKDAQGREFVMVGLNGGQFANDRYPLYEFVFLREPGQPLQLVASNRIFYDIAGFEGVTALSVFGTLAIGSAVLSAAAALALTGARAVQRSRTPTP